MSAAESILTSRLDSHSHSHGCTTLVRIASAPKFDSRNQWPSSFEVLPGDGPIMNPRFHLREPNAEFEVHVIWGL